MARRLLDTWALNAVAHAEALTSAAPTRGSESHAVAGGWLVLSGAGMYINRAMAAGLDVSLSAGDLDLIMRLSKASRVDPSVEVSPTTHQSTVAMLIATGFTDVPEGDVTALVKRTVAGSISAPDNVLVRPVSTEADLLLWQQTSAAGWGHTTIKARLVSNAWAAAANRVHGESMILAFDSADGRPLGCASSTLRNGVATLGGMSTLPTERRRGVQAALLRYRVDLATRHGCDLIATTASSGGASERNLRRHGFTPQFPIRTYTLHSTS